MSRIIRQQRRNYPKMAPLYRSNYFRNLRDLNKFHRTKSPDGIKSFKSHLMYCLLTFSDMKANASSIIELLEDDTGILTIYYYTLIKQSKDIIKI